jgi:cytokinin dehydrogenase
MYISDEATLGWAADDWGHIVHNRPLGVLRPRTVDDVVEAGARGLPLVARGQGHSTAGQAQAPGGIVVDMSGLHAVHEVAADRVVVDAGACWSEVLAATLPHGLTPPVLTDYLELSVGGTLSAGGIGGTTQHHGLQTDNVLELDVVTDGALRTCSRSRHRELFDAVRAGQGTLGIIVRATLRLTPAPEWGRRHQLYYRDLATFLADQRRVLADGRFDFLQGQAELDEEGRWHYVLDVASFGAVPHLDDLAFERGTEEFEELSYFDFLNRIAPLEALLRESGQWFHPHPWTNLFLPDSATDAVVAGTMAGLGVDDIGETGVILLYPFHTGRIATPGVRLPREPVAFLFALLRTAPPGDERALRRLLEANRRLGERVRAAGGTCYLPERPA